MGAECGERAVSSSPSRAASEATATPTTSNAPLSVEPTAAATISAPSLHQETALVVRDVTARERIAGSPLVPGGVQWAEDGRVSVVSEANIMISTFMNRELEMYIQNTPAISKSFIFLPDSTAHERVPLPIPVFSEPTDAHLPSGTLSCFLLNEKDRHQYNPKELSLSKNDGTAFTAATWGPRGSGPNSSCAILALTSSSRISLHVSSSFHLSWKEVAVFSECIFDFFETKQWTLRAPPASKPSGAGSSPATDGAATPSAETQDTESQAIRVTAASSKKRKRGLTRAKNADPTTADTMSMVEYARRCALLGTLSMAWSPFVTNAEQHTTSLIAFCGRAVTTIWAFDHPPFDAFDRIDKAVADSSSPPPSQSLLSSSPFAWIDTERYGWVTTCTWQQEHREASRIVADMRLAMGTSSGNVLLVTVPVIPRDVHVVELAIDRVIAVPCAQPVFSLRLGSRSTFSNSPRNDLVVASGSRISVWNIKKKRATPLTWRAHSGNVTGLDVDYFGKQVFSCGVDGQLRLWDGTTGEEIPFVSTNSSAEDGSAAALPVARPRTDTSNANYPMYGVSVSPNSAQLVSLLEYTRVSAVSIRYPPRDLREDFS
ncbi:hypothetical protein P43SY_007986 [Pythium insidiosum]|uniref:Uncharacterized protein n=1 Tax=Pythium insidiosum TaxID=114742 RepID=A0AAD5L7X6_PYTIN|nr:hypothetical protein P43SY_007986 [Pythium insidiosum]